MSKLTKFIMIAALCSSVSACAHSVTLHGQRDAVIKVTKDVLYGDAPCQFQVVLDGGARTVTLLPEDGVMCPLPDGLLKDRE